MADPTTDHLGESPEIGELIGQLQAIEQRLQLLTAGNVDAVVGPGGKSYLLHDAQLQLLQKEREQQAAGRELEIQRSQLLAAQAIAGIGSWTYHYDKQMAECSEEARRIFRIDRLSVWLSNGQFMELTHPDDRAALYANLKRATESRPDLTAGQPTYGHEHRLLLPDGGIRYIEHRWQIVRDEHGQPLRALGTCQDITQRKLTEQNLRSSQAFLGMAGRLGRIGAWSYDVSTGALHWSDVVSAIHEAEPGMQPSLDQALSLYPPASRDQLHRAHCECIERGAPFDLELEKTTFTGKPLWARIIGEAVRDEDSAIRGIQGAFQDISEAKAAERELHRVATLLSTTMDSVTSGFCIVDKSWRVTFVNSRTEVLFGRKRDQLLGQILWDIAPQLRGAEIERRFRRTFDAHLTDLFDVQLEPQGTWFRVSSYTSDEGFAFYMRDVSVEKAEQLQLKLLEACVSRLNDMVVITDAAPLDEPGPRIRFVNDAVLRITGLKREQVIGRSPRILQGPETSRAELDRIRAALSRFEPVSAELINYRHGVEPYWVELDILPIGDEASGYTHFVAIERDISERKRDQTALRELNVGLEARVAARTAEFIEAREAAELANRAKSTFLATMSHEIRTPMNGVIGLINLLAESTLDGAQAETVELIRDSADSLLKIIDDVLDFSKIEAGMLDIEQVPMDLSRSVENTCSLLDSMATEKSVGLLVFVDPRIPQVVLGDELRLRQVLTNLIGNAIKFSSGGAAPGQVSVSATLAERQGNSAIVDIVVTDNGIGMDSNTVARLFTPFVQGDASTTRRFGGTGLGLAISNMLVHRMDGKLTVASTLGRGSTFSLRMPFEIHAAPRIEIEGSELVHGLQCRIIGNIQPLATHLSTYLLDAGAMVEWSASLADAAAAERSSGLWLWLILPDQPVPPALPELRALATRQRNGKPGETRFMVLGRGGLRRVRAHDRDHVSIDVDALTRRSFFAAVATLAERTLKADTATGQATLADGHAAPQHQPSTGSMILVAEDNPTNQLVIRRQLQRLGVTADVAADGVQALERWRSGNYALILTDIRMPEMDGYALIKAIRAEEPAGRHTPIIALTANAFPEDQALSRLAGFDGHLVKPVTLPQLQASIEQWLGPAVAERNTSPEDTATTAAAKLSLDLDVLTSLIGDDPADIMAVLKTFRSTSERVSKELSRSISTGLLRPTVNAAHKMKSGAYSIGATQLGDVCAEIESTAEAGQSEQLHALLARFLEQMKLVRKALDSLGY